MRLTLPNRILFSTLYPNARRGDNALSSAVEEFITYDPDPPEDGGFRETMRRLVGAAPAHNGDHFRAGYYNPLSNLFLWSRDVFPLDVDVNVSHLGGAMFDGQFAGDITGLAKDFIHIFGVINAFEGWRFFDNKEFRRWRKWVDQLPKTSKDAIEIASFFKLSEYARLRNDLARNEITKFRAGRIDTLLPSRIRNNQYAKNFIYTSQTTGVFENMFTNEQKEVLAESLPVDPTRCV